MRDPVQDLIAQIDNRNNRDTVAQFVADRLLADWQRLRQRNYCLKDFLKTYNNASPIGYELLRLQDAD